MITTQKLQNLLNKKDESQIVDYKEGHYFEENGAEFDKNKPKIDDFILDMLSFVNTVRSETAYIIIGVKNKSLEIVGSHNIEFRLLYDKIKDKCNFVPVFHAYSFPFEGKILQIIDIPIAKYPYPCVLKNTLKEGRLEKNRVYCRKGDKNEEADQAYIKQLNFWLENLPNKILPLPSLTRYIEKVTKDYRDLQDFFVHLIGRQIAEVSLTAREIGTINPRANTVEKLCEDLSQKERRMLILGEPGMGKSTALKFLTYQLSQKFEEYEQPSYTKPLPLFLELRSADENVIDLIAESIENSFPILKKEALEDMIKKYLAEGAFMLFFDGLNEIIKDKNHVIVGKLKDFFKKYEACMFVISSRPEESRKRLHEIPTFELLPMDEEQQEDFLNKNTRKEEIKPIIAETREQYPDLKVFTGVPFLFLLLIRVVERTGKVPKVQTEIVKQFFYGLYELEIEKNPAFDAEKTHELLEFLAEKLGLKHENNPKVSEKLLCEYIGEKCNAQNWTLDPKTWLKKIVELNILVAENQFYAFRHQLFLETLYNKSFGENLEWE